MAKITETVILSSPGISRFDVKVCNDGQIKIIDNYEDSVVFSSQSSEEVEALVEMLNQALIKKGKLRK